jgi:hypothetical protein
VLIEVDAEVAPPGLLVELEQRRPARGAHDVDHGGEPRELVVGARDHALGVGRVGDVGDQRQRRDAVLRDLVGDCARALVHLVDQRDARAFARGQERRRTTDPLPGADDRHCAPGQTQSRDAHGRDATSHARTPGRVTARQAPASVQFDSLTT